MDRPAARPHLTDTQRRDWLRLIRTDGIGPRTFRALLNRYGGAQAALEALPALARRGQGPAPRIPSPAAIEAEMAAASAAGVSFIGLGEPSYPPMLRTIDDAPPLLAVRGSADILTRRAIALVGARNASAVGLRMTEILARGLGEAGFAIVSGLARGIDAAAHRASLKTGTVAVLAGGHARPYPAENIGLLEQLLEHGCAVSEMPLDWEARAHDFPRRNRIVSGMTLATVVVEAAQRSGSLITARLAAEQGREVFAVPGSPLDARAAGAIRLLKDGATMATEPADIIGALGGIALPPDVEFLGERERDAPAEDSVPETDRQRVIALLGVVPASLDEIVRYSGLPPHVVQGVILELEIAGRAERLGANMVALRAPG